MSQQSISAISELGLSFMLSMIGPETRYKALFWVRRPRAPFRSQGTNPI